MKNIFKNSLKGGVLAAFMLLGFSACTDDHFDINGGGMNAASDQTLWEVVQQKQDLKDLQTILSRVYLMRYETDKFNPSKTKHVSDLLNDPQSFTLWAPKDGTYDAKKYLDILDQADAVLAANGGVVNEEYQKLMYQVASQFLYNHVARFSYEQSKNAQHVTMLNGKTATYEAGKSLFNERPILESVMTSNGTMHMIDGISPFAYNIYDIIRSEQGLDSLRNYLFNPEIDKYVLNENRSIQGALNNDGNMVYVDSFYDHNNDLLKTFGYGWKIEDKFCIEQEDSTFVTIFPTDKAWNKTFDRIGKYYTYYKNNSGETVHKYRVNWDNNKGDFGAEYTMTPEMADSLSEYKSKYDVLTSCLFSPSIWKNIDVKNSEQVIAYATTADSLLSTRGACYYNSEYLKDRVRDKKHVNKMFLDANGQVITPIRASNGYVFLSDAYNVEPEYVWMQTQELDITGTGYYAQQRQDKCNCLVRNGESISVTDETRDPEVEDPHKVAYYRRFTYNVANEMTVDLKLPNLYSGAYSVKVVMVPTRLSQMEDSIPEVKFTCQVLDDAGKPLNIAASNGEVLNKNKTQEFVVDNDRVKTYNVIDKVEIPYSYVGLPEGNSFCRLRFTAARDRSVLQEDNMTAGLNFWRLYITPYREGDK